MSASCMRRRIPRSTASRTSATCRPPCSPRRCRSGPRRRTQSSTSSRSRRSIPRARGTAVARSSRAARESEARCCRRGCPSGRAGTASSPRRPARASPGSASRPAQSRARARPVAAHHVGRRQRRRLLDQLHGVRVELRMHLEIRQDVISPDPRAEIGGERAHDRAPIDEWIRLDLAGGQHEIVLWEIRRPLLRRDRLIGRGQSRRRMDSAGNVKKSTKTATNTRRWTLRFTGRVLRSQGTCTGRGR